MLRFILFNVVLFSSQLTWAQSSNSASAYRAPGVSYKAYDTRAWLMTRGTQLFSGRTARGSAQVFEKSSLPAATVWAGAGEMETNFKYFRDLRFVNDSTHEGFIRRSSWLFPDDGCFARADLAIANLIKNSIAAPKKVFVFGNLEVETINAPGGRVGWWYHVAPVVEVAGQKYVLDPAIEAKRPLPLHEWLAKMSPTPHLLEVAICGKGAYEPYDECENNDDRTDRSLADQQEYLDYEWDRLEYLNRDPVRELGDNPPWN